MSVKLKNGLNDSDKIFVTAALWISALTIFAVALTLPMLPSEVSIFYRLASEESKPNSKYNNLVLMLISVIPMAIIFTVTALRSRYKMRHNFPSVLLFCIMLSICMGGVMIYGIIKQFEASGNVASISNHSLITLSVCFLLSMVFAVLPSLINSESFMAEAGERSVFATRFFAMADRYWHIGAYGYLLFGVACAFVYNVYSYAVLAVSAVVYFIFFIVCYKKFDKRNDASPDKD
ncbi:MAG: hypothetical protein NC184_06170 [Roseburia sp.]|nr:hypothetical protein [Roseburia sp.]